MQGIDTSGILHELGNKLNVVDLDDTPANDSETAVTSKYLYRLVNSRCSVYLSGNQTITTSTQTIIEFDTKVTNSDPFSLWDTTNYWFIPAYNGWYNITCQAMIDDLDDGDAMTIFVYKNTSVEAQKSTYGMAASIAIYSDVNKMVYLTTSDKIIIKIWHNEGADQILSGTSQRTYLTINAVSLD